MVGTLLYAMKRKRSDIANAVRGTSQNMVIPNKSCMNQVCRIAQYLINLKDKEIKCDHHKVKVLT